MYVKLSSHAATTVPNTVYPEYDPKGSVNSLSKGDALHVLLDYATWGINQWIAV